MSKHADPSRVPGQRDPSPGLRNPVPAAQPSAKKPKLAAGARPLTAKEQAQRQRALSCGASDKLEATAGCSQAIDFNVFFDGTGNNRQQELAKPPERRALSNIAKLFDAHQTQQRPNRMVLYIPGVGTPFPTIGDPGGVMGQMIGKGSDQRIRYALEQLDRAIAAIPPAVKLRLITVNAFGFSRGAAAARAFARDLAARCTRQDGGHMYRGVPLRVGFMGLFDTVCSAYAHAGQASVSTNGGHNGWAHDMRMPQMVEQSVHMTAGHEARIRFPLDSVRDGARYPANAHEVCFPGMHADVGGGYSPYEQGPRNTLSRIPLNQMMVAARTGGVRLRSVEVLRPEVRQEFELDDAMRQAFNAYNQALGKTSATLEELQAGHMQLLHRWLKQRVASAPETEGGRRLKRRAQQVRQERVVLTQRIEEFQRKYRTPFLASAAERRQHEANVKRRRDGYEELKQIDDETTDLAEENSKVLKDIASLRKQRDRGERLSLSQKTMLEAWDNEAPLPASVARFFDLYTHDSISHFDYDSSRLTNWRTIYFGQAKYSPT